MEPSSQRSGISDIEAQQLLENCHRTEAHIWNALQSRQIAKVLVCTKKHPLEIVLDSSYALQQKGNRIPAACDLCQQIINGACWRCKACQYDVCFDCETFPHTLCYRRHPMSPVTQEHLINITPVCRVCMRKIYLACYSVCCELCEYDICGNCCAKPVSISSAVSNIVSSMHSIRK